jgi:hypothetical protein
MDILLSRPEVAVDEADNAKDTPLHLAARGGFPMCAFNLAKALPRTCLVLNMAGESPKDVAVAASHGEVALTLLFLADQASCHVFISLSPCIFELFALYGACFSFSRMS